MKKILSAALCAIFFGGCVTVQVMADTVEEKEEIIYAPSVEWESLEEMDTYLMEENASDCQIRIPKTEETKAVSEGERIVLPANDGNPAGAALVVTGIAEEGGELYWTCEEPVSLADFVESIDISGYGEFLPQQAKSRAASVNARGIGVNAGGEASEAGRIDYQFENTALNGAAVLNGTVSIEISSIEYRLKMDVGIHDTNIEDFYFAVNHTVNVDADIAFQTEGLLADGEIELGSVPFVLGKTGVNGEITFWLNYDAKGNINVSYTLSNLAGITYENGTYHSFAKNQHTLAAAAGFDFTVGPKMQFVLRFGSKMKLMDVTLASGLTGNSSLSAAGVRPDDMGYRMELYAYLNMYPGKEGIVNRALGLKDTELWTYETSPFHKTIAGTF